MSFNIFVEFFEPFFLQPIFIRFLSTVYTSHPEYYILSISYIKAPAGVRPTFFAVELTAPAVESCTVAAAPHFIMPPVIQSPISLVPGSTTAEFVLQFRV